MDARRGRALDSFQGHMFITNPSHTNTIGNKQTKHITHVKQARQCAERCLRTFDASPQHPTQHHRVTWKWLSRDSPLRTELEAFVSGASMAGLPLLSTGAAELFFMPTAERVQEAEHAVIKQKTSATHHLSAPYISLCIRLADLERVVSEPERFQCMVDLFTVKPDEVAQRCSIFKHPLWQQQAVGANYSKKTQILGMILYSVDPHSQFTSIEAVRKKREERKTARKRVLPKKVKACFSLENVKRVMMAEHMHSMLKPGVLYSMPPSLVRSVAADAGEHVLAPLASAAGLISDVCDDFADPFDDESKVLDNLFSGWCRQGLVI